MTFLVNKAIIQLNADITVKYYGLLEVLEFRLGYTIGINVEYTSLYKFKLYVIRAQVVSMIKKTMKPS